MSHLYAKAVKYNGSATNSVYAGKSIIGFSTSAKPNFSFIGAIGRPPFVYVVRGDKSTADDCVAMNATQMECLGIREGDPILLHQFSQPRRDFTLESLELEVYPPMSDALKKKLHKKLRKQVFIKSQKILIEIEGKEYKIWVTALSRERGMVSPNTILKFTKSMVFNWNLDLKSGGLGCLGGLQKQYDEICRRLILDLESAGLGGLQKQYDEIYRRLILQRAIPPEMLEKGLKVRYTKGLLLYGPAGTGKTALSNVISLHLSNQRAKIIRGPGVLNEDGGESRRVVMEIFEDAKRDFKMHGNNSRIHVIIFDDLDLIAKRKDGRCTEWRDTLVNQLFSMINDPDGLDNILVIGTTNRIDLIDPYILRPGRFEVCIEMPLYQTKIGDFADKGVIQVWETTGAIKPKNHISFIFIYRSNTICRKVRSMYRALRHIAECVANAPRVKRVKNRVLVL